MADVTTRRIIRDWWRQAIDGQESVDARELARAGADELIQDDEFRTAFLGEFLYSIVYDIGQNLMASDRAYIRSGDQFKTREQLAREIRAEGEEEAVNRTWAAWLEYDPISKVNIALSEMTKEQLLAAGHRRIERGHGDIRDGQWMLLLGGRLKDGQKGRDVWSDAEAMKLRENIEISTSVSLKGVKRQTRKAA